MGFIKIFMALCAFFHLASNASAENVICASDIQYDYDNDEHKKIIQATLNEDRSPQELLDLLQSLDKESKTALLNRGIKAKVMDNNQPIQVRYTSLINELILRQPQHPEKAASNNLKIRHLLDHGYRLNQFFTRSMPDGTIEVSTLPLANAIYMGNVEITKLLLERKANPHMIYPAGQPHTPSEMLLKCLFDSYSLQNNNDADSDNAPPASFDNYLKIADLVWQ